MNLGFNGSMLPDYKNTKYCQYPRNPLSQSSSQPSYPPRQTSTNHPKSLSERISRSTTNSLYDNNSLNNESIKSYPSYQQTYQTSIIKIKSWDEREEVNDGKSQTSQIPQSPQSPHSLKTLQSLRPSSELCAECGKLFNGKKWCRPCNAEHFRGQTSKWTSWNPDLDNFLNKTQITANNVHSFFEWVPFMNFVNIKYMAKGESSSVYRAIWKQGPILYWDTNTNNWKRFGSYEVVLKVIKGSQKNFGEFINAVCFDFNLSFIYLN
jgi:hypothetical protein